MKIQNLNIHGGNQQFADTIINSSDTFDEVDRSLIQLIHDEVATKEGRVELLNSLEVMKSPHKTDEEKKGAGSIFKKFIDSVATEGGKQLVKELAEKGVDYIQYLS